MAGLFGPAPKEPYYAKRVRGEVPKGYRQAAGLLAEMPGFAGDAVSAADLISGIKDKDWLKASLAGVSLLPGIPNLGGIMIGRNAKTFDEGAVEQYLKNKGEGAPKETNWLLTNTGETPLGAVAQEIDDSAAKLKVEQVPKVESPIEVVREWMRQRNIPLVNESTGRREVPYEADDYASRLYRAQMEQSVRLGDVFEHPELYKAYPEAAEIRVSGLFDPDGRTRGSFDIANKRIRLATANSPEQNRSTLLHELQHYVQQREGWPSGGSPTNADVYLKRAAERALQPTQQAASTAADLRQQLGRIGRTEYANKLIKLAGSETITPRQVTGMSSWYQHSDVIRGELGPMPKRSGPEQKSWLRKAAEMLYTLEESRGMFRGGYSHLTPKELTNRKRRVERAMEKVAKAEKEHNALDTKYGLLQAMSRPEMYRHMGGEAEARLVQARKDLTGVDRAQRYPFEEKWVGNPYGYDVRPSLLFRP